MRRIQDIPGPYWFFFYSFDCNEPIHIQYWEYLKTVATGDLGTTIRSRRPVTDELKERFPATIELAVA